MATRRERILEVTRDLALEEGVARLSMRRIAAKVGVSATAIYRHYRNKDDLLAAVVGEGFRVFASYLFQALAGKTPRERLELAGQRYLEFALEQPRYYQVIFMSWHSLDPELHGEQPRDRLSPTYQFLIDRVTECRDAGLFVREVEPQELAVFLWSQCHGLASLYIAGGADRQMRRDEFLALARRLLHLAIRGVLA